MLQGYKQNRKRNEEKISNKWQACVLGGDVIFMILIMIVAGGTQQSLVLGIESLESTQSLTKVFKTYHQEFKKNQ